MEYRCSTKWCRGEPVIKALGKDLCEECWEKRCEESEHIYTYTPVSR